LEVGKLLLIIPFPIGFPGFFGIIPVGIKNPELGEVSNCGLTLLFLTKVGFVQKGSLKLGGINLNLGLFKSLGSVPIFSFFLLVLKIFSFLLVSGNFPL